MAPPGFHFRDWRREMEQAIARGEAIPIRVLLEMANAPLRCEPAI